jgi:hypothetical protein
MSSGIAQFSGRKQPTTQDDEGNPEKILLFSDGKAAWVSVTVIDGRVLSLLRSLIPALFDDAGTEHEDHAGVVTEIQGAVWLAARTIANYKLINCSADTLKELEVIGRGGYINTLESRLNTQNFDDVSDEAWFEVVKLKRPTLTPGKPLALSIEEFTKLAAVAARTVPTGKVRDSEAKQEAVTLLTERVIKALSGQEAELGIRLVSYSARQKPSRIVEVLFELGKIAGITLALGTWRNALMREKRTADQS